MADVGVVRNPAPKRATAGVGPSKSNENIPNIVLMILVSAARSMPGPGRGNPLTLEYRSVLGVVLFSTLAIPKVSLSQAGDGTGLIYAELNPAVISILRSEMPALRHRRF